MWAAENNTRISRITMLFFSEAPAEISRKHRPVSAPVKASENGSAKKQGKVVAMQTSQPVDIVYKGKCSERDHERRALEKQKSCSSSEAQREEAWRRRKDRHSVEYNSPSKYQNERMIRRTVGDPVSIAVLPAHKFVFRAKSLTDEDLDELRGCIDLGFSFSNEANPELWNTLPALELCYNICQQLEHQHSPPSPQSEQLDNELDSSATFSSSVASPSPSTSWMLSSPGDNPEEVKERLRLWAQAVACTIRGQNYTQPNTRIHLSGM